MAHSLETTTVALVSQRGYKGSDQSLRESSLEIALGGPIWFVEQRHSCSSSTIQLFARQFQCFSSFKSGEPLPISEIQLGLLVLFGVNFQLNTSLHISILPPFFCNKTTQKRNVWCYFAIEVFGVYERCFLTQLVLSENSSSPFPNFSSWARPETNFRLLALAFWLGSWHLEPCSSKTFYEEKYLVDRSEDRRSQETKRNARIKKKDGECLLFLECGLFVDSPITKISKTRQDCWWNK